MLLSNPQQPKQKDSQPMTPAVFSHLFYAPRWYAEFVVYPPLRFMSFGVAIQAEDHLQFIKIGVLFFSLIIGRR